MLREYRRAIARAYSGHEAVKVEASKPLAVQMLNCRLQAMLTALVAAGAGNLFDSYLGATIERRGLVGNGIVNFAGTSFAGGLALGLLLTLHLV